MKKFLFIFVALAIFAGSAQATAVKRNSFCVIPADKQTEAKADSILVKGGWNVPLYDVVTGELKYYICRFNVTDSFADSVIALDQKSDIFVCSVWTKQQVLDHLNVRAATE